ncbi:MAG TPA: carboxypeptidase-like regulatory domain-containing protein [Saprospiraceae bacterium]|nr:carboxypeptidase-like regulatory domain-containing protein [Saprospiraceae bacterium]HMP25420.1 carboxypeptidase-like regulatory domain-containing protein [Saprospiraceae bacterium]
MKFLFYSFLLNIILIAATASTLHAQRVIRGTVLDGATGETLISASVVIKGTAEGAITDYDGTFRIETSRSFPITLVVSYVGYAEKEVVVESERDRLRIQLLEDAITIAAVEVTGRRISERQQQSPLTMETLDNIGIRETPAANFYDGLGALKDVDLTAASLGFKIINTRGFNSTSPVRSLQIIDGVDNQSPGLNFSLGNFLGSSELDVNRVNLIIGASSAFYGPNAFNGVISMETKNPFLHKGLSGMVKVGERNLVEVSARWAQVLKNKEGQELLAYKFNFSAMRANDWEAENYDPVDGTLTGVDNPGRFDAVNIYGDEYFSLNDLSTAPPWTFPGLGVWHRPGYREIDLVDYNTRNFKTNVAMHLRTNPSKGLESPELILSSSMGGGTTVYQGDNRFSLRDILFFQNRIEYRKEGKFFLRGYATNEDAGRSYDPYFTALLLQESAKSDELWSQDYTQYWRDRVAPRIRENGYPQLNFSTFPPTFDFAAAEAWNVQFRDSLRAWHTETANAADRRNIRNPETTDFLRPGTPEFEEAFNRITSNKSSDKREGTRFFDRSALYHVHGEYKFEPTWTKVITVGGNMRFYRPNTEGTIFSDTAGIRIRNQEFGLYAGIEKEFFDRKLRASATARIDKNENFDLIYTPAASLVWNPSGSNYIRASFSSALRNPTLADQYLFLNVGRAILAGNLNGADSLITLESFNDFREDLNRERLVYFDVAPVKPEQVRTFEVGYRTILFNKLYLDAGYYYSFYDDFLGFNIGLTADFDEGSSLNLPTNVQAFRFAANSINQVTTQGFSIGTSYYFADYFQVSANYSFNRLNSDLDDPIIPAFNTPEHKFNIGFSGRDVVIGGIRNAGFSINYKWQEGFLFEGSPQFTGLIPSYDLLDAQINWRSPRINTTFKLGASNLMNNQIFQTYGGPRIGRLGYFSILYEGKGK